MKTNVDDAWLTSFSRAEKKHKGWFITLLLLLIEVSRFCSPVTFFALLYYMKNVRDMVCLAVTIHAGLIICLIAPCEMQAWLWLCTQQLVLESLNMSSSKIFLLLKALSWGYVSVGQIQTIIHRYDHPHARIWALLRAMYILWFAVASLAREH